MLELSCLKDIVKVPIKSRHRTVVQHGLCIQSTESFEVSQLKMAGCDYYTVSEAFIKFKYVTSVTVQYSHNFDLNVQLDRLQTLNLSYNALQTIPEDFSKRAPELRVIDFSYNRLIQLQWDSFQDARNSREICLSHNIRSSSTRNFDHST